MRKGSQETKVIEVNLHHAQEMKKTLRHLMKTALRT